MANSISSGAKRLAQTIDLSVFMARKVIPLDPWWDTVRAAPEFVALLGEPATQK